MKTLYKILAALAVPVLLITYSFSGGSPGGQSGSPLDGSDCTSCHQGGSATQQEGWITTNIPSEGYMPGATYTITAMGTHSGVVKFGFELTAENAGGKVGTLAVTESARTQLTNGNNAITHTAGGTAPSGNSITWAMDWTAPAEGEGPVTFYSSFNAANGNGGNSGDVIYLSNTTVNEFVPQPALTSVDPDHGEQGWMGSITIMGENTTWNSGVFAVQFKNHDDPMVSFSGNNVQVKSDTELTCDVSIPIDLVLGAYDVSVDGITLPNGFTVDVASSIGNDQLASTVSVYPNPASNYVMVNVPESSQISLVDMNGRQIYTKSNSGQKESLDVSALESGIYFIQILHEGNSATKRLLVK